MSHAFADQVDATVSLEPAGSPLKVLYIDGVGPFGGASRSLYEALSAFPEGTVAPHFLMQHGTAMDFYGRRAVGIETVRGLPRFDHSRASWYHGVRWLVPIRELGYVPFGVAGLLRARKRWPDIDLIHANEICELPMALLAKKLFGVPLVVHVRSIQLTDRSYRRTRWYHRQLRDNVDKVVAIDENVRASLPRDADVQVIHNSFTPRYAAEPDHAYLAQFDKLRPNSLKVGFVGNLHRAKGVGELVQAARIVKDRGGDVQFLIVGGGTGEEKGLVHTVVKAVGLAQNMQGDFWQSVSEMGLADDVLALGPTTDIQRVYERMDVVAFPSYFDAPGRPVFEAAFSAVPAIVAVSHPRPDTLADRETGIAIPDPDPEKIADAVMYFERNRDEVRRMGENARRLAERNFSADRNARELLGVYRAVVQGKAGQCSAALPS